MDSAQSTTMRSKDEMEAAEALILFSRRAVVIPPAASPSPPNDQYETDTDEEIFGPSGPGYRSRKRITAIVQRMSRGKRATTQPEAKIVLPSSLPTMIVLDPSTPWFHELFKRAPLRGFVQLGLRASTLEGEGERRVAAFFEGLTATDRNCVQEACWYLEFCDWDVALAIAQYRIDEKIRENGKMTELYAAANLLAKQVTSANFSASHLRLSIKSKSTTKVFGPFTKAEDFNQHNRDHIKALNQWRNDIFRLHNGIPANSAFPPSADKYSEFEDRFLRNRLGSSVAHHGLQGDTPLTQEITDEFNAIFVGRFLPCAKLPSGLRIYGGLKRHIDLKIIGSEPEDPSYRQIVLHLAHHARQIQETEMAEFEALVSVPESDQTSCHVKIELAEIRGPVAGVFE